MIDACIVAKLTGDSAVGAMVAMRIYPLVLPENSAKPAITYRIISTVRDYDLDGANGGSDLRLQLDLWGSYADVRKLGKLTQANLEDFSGPLTSSQGNCNVLLISLNDEDTGFDQLERSHYLQQDWKLQFTD